jgi:hypothetical protein
MFERILEAWPSTCNCTHVIASTIAEMFFPLSKVIARNDSVALTGVQSGKTFGDTMFSASKEWMQSKNSTEFLPTKSSDLNEKVQPADSIDASDKQAPMVQANLLTTHPAQRDQDFQLVGKQDVIGVPVPFETVSVVAPLQTKLASAKIESAKGLSTTKDAGSPSITAEQASQTNANVIIPEQMREQSGGAQVVVSTLSNPTVRELTSPTPQSSTSEIANVGIANNVSQPLLSAKIRTLMIPFMAVSSPQSRQTETSSKTYVEPHLVIGPESEVDQAVSGLAVTPTAANMFASPIASGKNLHASGEGVSAKDGNTANGLVVGGRVAAEARQHYESSASSTNSQAEDSDGTKAGAALQDVTGAPDQNILMPQMTTVERMETKDMSSLIQGTPRGAQSGPSQAGNSRNIEPSLSRTDGAPAPTATVLPTINSAKVLQTMGQTEMRVGMNSTEFGNISIRTSATRDTIVAQISLDHGELAKELAVHLPEMQEKLGSTIPTSVRIDLINAPMGQGTGTPGGMSNGTAGNSGADKQQSRSAHNEPSGINVIGRQDSHVPALLAREDTLNTRLDIRI